MHPTLMHPTTYNVSVLVTFRVSAPFTVACKGFWVIKLLLKKDAPSMIASFTIIKVQDKKKAYVGIYALFSG